MALTLSSASLAAVAAAAALAGGLATAWLLQSPTLLRWLRWIVGLPATTAAPAARSGGGALYGLRHRLLNVPPDPPLWLNMGLWNEGARTLPEAAAALARCVGQLAQLRPGSTIFGTGPEGHEGLSLLAF